MNQQPSTQPVEVEPFDEAPPFEPVLVARSLRAAGAWVTIENTGGNVLAVVTETTRAGSAYVVATTDEGAARYTRTAWHDSGDPDAVRWLETDERTDLSEYVDITLDLLGT